VKQPKGDCPPMCIPPCWDQGPVPLAELRDLAGIAIVVPVMAGRAYKLVPGIMLMLPTREVFIWHICKGESDAMSWSRIGGKSAKRRWTGLRGIMDRVDGGGVGVGDEAMLSFFVKGPGPAAGLEGLPTRAKYREKRMLIGARALCCNGK